MKITIEIPDRDIKILSEWASVSRTLNEAKRHCEDELDILEPVLNRLHQIIREQIWQNQNDKKDV